MIQRSTLPLFHFLFSELIEECFHNHREGYLQALKKSGYTTGMKLFNTICIKKQITERPKDIATLARNIQTKVFKFVLGYEASSIFPATGGENENGQTQYYLVIVDNVSVYLSWMPEHYWETSAFFAGLIESILQCSGFDHKVTSESHLESGQNPQTQFRIKIGEDEYRRLNLD